MPSTVDHNIKIEIEHLCFYYGAHRVLDNISACFQENAITALIGNSGEGKSTFLKTLNRLWEETPGASLSGHIRVRFGETLENIYSTYRPVYELRKKIGMVFQTPNTLPMSVFKNVAFPLKLSGVKKKYFPDLVEAALKSAYLWEEVKNRLSGDARSLSGGQQQRLCIARALIAEPEVLLLDEPTSSLDEQAGEIIEALLLDLKSRCTLLVVSHDIAQVNRIADACYRLSENKLNLWK